MKQETMKQAAYENDRESLPSERRYFIEGARWAEKITIERVSEWLKEHHHEYASWDTEEYELNFATDNLIDDLKKYIEKAE